MLLVKFLAFIGTFFVGWSFTAIELEMLVITLLLDERKFEDRRVPSGSRSRSCIAVGFCFWNLVVLVVSSRSRFNVVRQFLFWSLVLHVISSR